MERGGGHCSGRLSVVDGGGLRGVRTGLDELLRTRTRLDELVHRLASGGRVRGQDRRGELKGEKQNGS